MQLKRLPEFIEARKQNWETLRRGLADLENVLEFALPTHATGWVQEKGFSWDDTGGPFSLEAQTNTLSVGLSTIWAPYPNGTNGVSVPIDPANPTVFFRLSN